MKNNLIFFKDLWREYETELNDSLKYLHKLHSDILNHPTPNFPKIRRHANGLIAGSVDFIDAIYLYLLVRKTKPETIFEVGTWTGMSSMFLAEAVRKNNKGHIYTCDINNYYLLGSKYDNEVTRINKMSDEAICDLPKGKMIDMVFLDGDVDEKTTETLVKLLHNNSLIITHDFTFPGEKGVSNLVKLQKKTSYKYDYVFPSAPKETKINVAHEPNSLGLLMNPTKSSHSLLTLIYRRIKTAYFETTILIGRIYRKIRRLVS